MSARISIRVVVVMSARISIRVVVTMSVYIYKSSSNYECIYL
jgi:hypothetical protein